MSRYDSLRVADRGDGLGRPGRGGLVIPSDLTRILRGRPGDLARAIKCARALSGYSGASPMDIGSALAGGDDQLAMQRQAEVHALFGGHDMDPGRELLVQIHAAAWRLAGGK